MSRLGAAYVEISANISRLDTGLKRAKADTNKFLKGVSRDMESLNFMPLAKNIAMIGWQFAQITAPVTAVTGALFALTKHTANVGESLLKLKEKTGVSIEELYSLKKLAELSDISLSELGNSFKFLAQNIIEARTENTEMNRVFKALAVDATRPLMEVFTQLAKKFNDFADGEEKIALATKIFGKSGQEIIPVLNDIAEKGLKVSNIFTEDTAKAAAEFNDNLRELKQVAEEVGFAIGNKLMPGTANFLKNMQSVRGFFLQFFPEFLLPLEKLRDLGDTAWNTYVRGITEATTATEDFKIATRGATDIADLPFSFGGEAFQPKKPVPAIPGKEKEKKDDAVLTAKAISEAYSDMYQALRFDTERYYQFQKGLIEKRRDEEIKVTGDLALAWEAYDARLRELDEARMARSNSMSDGIQLFYSDLQRNGFTVAQGTKEMFQDAYSGMQQSFSGFFSGVMNGQNSILDTWLNFVNSMRNAFIQAVADMMAKWLMFKIASGVGGSFLGGFLGGGTPAPTTNPFAPVNAPLFHSGGLASDEMPAILQKGERVLSKDQNKNFEMMMSRNAGGQPVIININTIDGESTAHWVSKNRNLFAAAVMSASSNNHPIRRW